MTISETKKMLESYTGTATQPADFEAFWQERLKQAKQAAESTELTSVAFQNPAAQYYELHAAAADGTALMGRYICPVAQRPAPVVLMFHDDTRPIRGWHHMTRFVALGYSVVALQNRVRLSDSAEEARNNLEHLYTDALTIAFAAQRFPRTASKRMITWGEGLGGGLAVCVAALLPESVAKCAALSLLPADFGAVQQQNEGGICEGVLHCVRGQSGPAADYLDCANFAPFLRCDLLMGMCGMDTYAPPAMQYAVYNRAVCRKRSLFYPKYIHERVNYFEDELTAFLHF